MHHRPDIVLISLDCVRPDFLGCYGCHAVRTPHLDRMAARGVVFDLAVSQAPNTWVSHAGIFTGCYPPVHGLRSPYDAILEDVPTLAGILQSCGYTTAGFPGNDLVGSRMGFARGFDLFFEEYRDRPTQREPGDFPAGAAPGNEASTGVSANTRNDWEEVLEAAAGWLSREKEPVFLWLHYLETHHLPDLLLPVIQGIVGGTYFAVFLPSGQAIYNFNDGSNAYPFEIPLPYPLGNIEVILSVDVEQNAILIDGPDDYVIDLTGLVPAPFTGFDCVITAAANGIFDDLDPYDPDGSITISVSDVFPSPGGNCTLNPPSGACDLIVGLDGDQIY